MKIVKVEDKTHQELKVLAAKRGLTMKELVAKLIEESK